MEVLSAQKLCGVMINLKFKSGGKMSLEDAAEMVGITVQTIANGKMGLKHLRWLSWSPSTLTYLSLAGSCLVEKCEHLKRIKYSFKYYPDLDNH